jgi:hypothetical protein
MPPDSRPAATRAAADDRFANGYPPALDALHRRICPDRLVCSSAGHVVASIAAAPDAPPGPLSRLGLAVLTDETEPTPEAAALLQRFSAGLLGLHHELLEHALHQVMRHLGGRTSGGTTLLSRQLIKGQLADIALRLSEDKEILAQPDAGQWARWRTHQRQVAIGRSLLRLLGASGFLADGLGCDLHLAEVVGNVYLHPASKDSDG